jgi:exopolysaccharide production protein ExoQ
MTIPRKFLEILADCYTVAVLFFSSGAFVTVLVNTDDPAQFSEGSPLLKGAWILVYLITLVRLIGNRHMAVQILSRAKPLMLLLFFSLGSVLWSIAPDQTIHQGSSLALSAMFALDMSLRYSIEKQLRLLSIALLIATGLSVLTEVGFPGVVPGREFEGEGWHGIFGWKNDFGHVICLTIVVCLARIRSSKLIRFSLAGCGVAIAVLSRSVSAAMYAMLITGVFHYWPVFKWHRSARRAALAATFGLLLIAAYVLSQNLPRATAMVGKNSHLSGRTNLWQLAIDDIRIRPILGYGYQAFWNVDSQPARRIREEIHWNDAPHAHNGYIDMALSLGLPGLIVYFYLCWSVLRLAFRHYRGGDESYRRWPLTFLVLVLVYQFSESSIVSGNNCFWIIFCTLFFSLAGLPELRPAPVKVISGVRQSISPNDIQPSIPRLETP